MNSTNYRNQARAQRKTRNAAHGRSHRAIASLIAGVILIAPLTLRAESAGRGDPDLDAAVVRLQDLLTQLKHANEQGTATSSKEVPFVEIDAEVARLQQLLARSRRESAATSDTGAGAVAGAAGASRAQQTSVAAAAAATTTRAAAQGGSGSEALEEVVISAERIVKEIPRSVAVVSGVELETFHVDNFRDILDRVGNVRTSWQNPQTTAIISRGVGWSAGTGVLDPSVGVMVDGVSYGVTGIAALSNFTDIEDVQVVRGPQGIDGGRQTSVGRIQISTKRPSFTEESNLEVIVGQLNHLTTTAAIGGPISDGLLAYRFSFNRETADGAYHNKNDVYNTYRNTDRTNARLQFLLTPSSNFEARLSINFTPTGKEMCENCFNFNTKTPAYYDNIGANGQPVPFNYANDPYGKLQRRWFTQNTNFTLDDFYSQNYVDRLSDYPNQYATKGAALNLEDRLNDSLTLSSITAYQDFVYRQGRGSLIPFNTVLAPQGTSNTYWQASQEFKLDWAINPTLRSEVGAIYFRRDFSLIGQLTRYGPDAGAWYSNAAQYAILDPVNPLLPNATNAAGWELLKNSADGLITDTKSTLHSDSSAAYANLVWKATPKLAITAGARATREERTAAGSSLIEAEGYAPELDPVVVNNVHLGGFASDASGNLLAANSAAQLALANITAQKYFGAASYAVLTAAQKLQVATAKAIRLARLGALYLQTTAEPYSATLPTYQLGLTYQLSPSKSVYASWAHGTKAGVSQISGGTILGGKSVPVDSESSDSFDLGLKSIFLRDTLAVDATLYLQNIHNYIQNGVRYDPVQTALNNNGTIAYLTSLVNVPKVQTKGAELSLSYSGIEHTTLRFSGAYTDAVYESFPQAATPWELQGDPTRIYTDQSGHVLPGAPKFSGNVFVNFSYPIRSNLLFHANANYNYTSGYYSDQSLSRYLFTPATGVTDINVGVGREDGKFDVGLLVKNVFEEDTGVWLADQTPIARKPGVPRWIGVVFRTGY